MTPAAVVFIVAIPVLAIFGSAIILTRQRHRHQIEMAEMEIRRMEVQAELLRSVNGLPDNVDQGDPDAVEAWRKARREVEAMSRKL